MTANSIIIDGVDVSGCEFYRMTNMGNFYCRSNKKDFSEFCEKISNCYYKQLQRMKEDLTALQQTYTACEKEYKALKEKYIKVLELSKKGVDSYEYCIRDLEGENQKLKAKIKEISEKLDDALDPEETQAEESMDLLWEISEDLENLTTSFNVDEKGG